MMNKLKVLFLGTIFFGGCSSAILFNKELDYDNKFIYYSFSKIVDKAVDDYMNDKDWNSYFLLLNKKEVNIYRIYFHKYSLEDENPTCITKFIYSLSSSNRILKTKRGSLPIVFFLDFAFANRCSRSVSGSYFYIEFNRKTGEIIKTGFG